MKLLDLFRKDNNIDEKNVTGFISFGIMVLFALTDLIIASTGHHLTINETVYNSFVFVTLGSFGISAIGSAISGKNKSGGDQ